MATSLISGNERSFSMDGPAQIFFCSPCLSTRNLNFLQKASLLGAFSSSFSSTVDSSPHTFSTHSTLSQSLRNRINLFIIAVLSVCN